MKSRAVVEVCVTLTLNTEEAIWLREWTQNPFVRSMGRGLPNEESPEDKEMREKFWEALQIEDMKG